MKTFLNENQLIMTSCQHYGGFSGFQDYGLNGCFIKNAIISTWRNLFVKNNIYEVELPSLMLYAVLRASGHVDRFTDAIVTDENGVCHRADHFAKKWFESNGMPDMAYQVDSWDLQTLQNQINSYAMLGCTNSIVSKKNLMMEVGSDDPDFLRPELAQGIFVNFKYYQSYLQPDQNTPFIPFGVAQIGKSYRKEISPQPYIRLREFTQAEIEYFVDPLDKNHEDFDNCSNIIIPILTSDMQLKGQDTINISIGRAVEENYISHKLMAYFLARIYHFALKIGLKYNKIRFRQHLPNEMAHYSSQCWDLECFVNGSWLECVGCADRGCYDLDCHSKINTNQPLVAKRKLAEPIKKMHYTITPDVSKLRALYPRDVNNIKLYFKNLDQDMAKSLASSLQNNMYGTICIITNDDKYFFDSSIFNIKAKETIISSETFIPHVIEPSFGIDRLFYATIEHNMWQRESDERRLVLSLPPLLHLYDIAVFPLHKKDPMIMIANKIRNSISGNLRCYCDDTSTAIGKKYVRCDEIGVKYVVTVDPGTIVNGLVTVRERDSMNQISVDIDELINSLSSGNDYFWQF